MYTSGGGAETPPAGGVSGTERGERMNEQIRILAVTAASIGLIHTLIGPDHYLPFIMMARAGRWSQTKTALVTFLCGIGHVGSSVVLGFIGILLGMQLARLEAFESIRGDLAAWALIVFGLLYFLWGVRRAVLNKPHTHLHLHATGHAHEHEHVHADDAHAHAHVEEGRPNYTPWVLFVIFVLGPCEPLIPLVMYPAAHHDMRSVALVAGIFSVTTIATMLIVVMFAAAGFRMVSFGRFERWTHALAGGIIFVSGLGIKLLGL